MRAIGRAFAAAGRALRGVVALVALAGLAGGMPWLLVVHVGWPLADHIPTPDELVAALGEPLDDRRLINLIAALGWALWLLFVRDLVAEAFAAVVAVAKAQHGRQPPSRAQPRGPVRLVAAALVSAIVGAVPFGTTHAVAASHVANHGETSRLAHTTHTFSPTPAGSATHATIMQLDEAEGSPTSYHAVPVEASSQVSRAHGDGGSHAPAWAREVSGEVHHVVRGDNLWDIAEARLGDPFRWREVFVLNRGRPQADGRTLVDPDEIRAGWVLALPTPVKPPAKPARPPATPPQQTPHGEPSQPAELPTEDCKRSTEAGPGTQEQEPEQPAAERPGVSLPSGAWVSLSLAAAIAATATAVRLHERRRARLSWPIHASIEPTSATMPTSLHSAIVGSGRTHGDQSGEVPGVVPTPPATPTAIGVDGEGREIGLFEIAPAAVCATGPGAESAARAVIAAALSTAVLGSFIDRPVVLTPVPTLTRLLPPDVEPGGIDPEGRAFDGERLLLAADPDDALAQFETEMIHRQRTLDELHARSAAELRERDDHAEYLPPFVFVSEAEPSHANRMNAVLDNGRTLNMRAVILGQLPGSPTWHVTADGTATALRDADRGSGDGMRRTDGRLATLAAGDLAGLLDLLRNATFQFDDPRTGQEDATTAAEPVERPAEADAQPVPVVRQDSPTAICLAVLGPVTVATAEGQITSNIRSDSYAVLALLATHPRGRSLQEITADLYPDGDPKRSLNRVRTAITSLRRVLRTATRRETDGSSCSRTTGTASTQTWSM